ncbi:prolyl oligopeptidase family serine peptidase, partial [bacterium]|nr:prolyl oligopeptidase family serine peptidase [bacterium]
MISSATSAVNYVTARGVCDPRRCAVGGHSYGSFMTAHLLSHTSLFAAGIGRSGAFNRTLTPMSFQVTFVSPSFLLVLLSSSHLLYCIRDGQRKGAYGMHQ